MSAKTLLLAFMLLASLYSCLQIIPDTQNPIQMNIPTNQLVGQAITFKFTLGTSLNYRQVFGVSFPANINTDTAFEAGSRYGCSLTDGNTTYALTPVAPVAAENWIAYCQLSDAVNNNVKAGVSLSLTITLTSVKFTNNYLRNVGVFTATTNSVDKVFIDYVASIGTIGTYPGDWKSVAKAIEISSATLVPTSGPNASAGAGAIYGGNTFNIVITLKANMFITAADNTIVITYPTSLVATAATTVTTQAAVSGTTDKTKFALTASSSGLTVAAFGTGALVISGIGEDLIPGRTFTLTLTGWKAVAAPTTTATSNIEVFVYYKNTYSIYGYANAPVFAVSKGSLTLAVQHPESWDIFAGGAWPVVFTITPSVDYTNGAWVVIQHANAVDTKNKFAFIASTCDFSAITSSSTIDNSFTKRGSCYPLRNDMNFGTLSTAGNGSGVFFKLGSMTASTSYAVTIWGFAEVCGAGIDPFTNSGSDVTQTFGFQATFYNNIIASAVHDARFSTTAAAPAIQLAQSSVISTLKCWNTIVQDTGAAVGSAVTPFDLLTSIGTYAVAGSKDIMFYKEVPNFNIIYNPNPNTCSDSGTTCYAFDVSAASPVFTESFLYSITTASTDLAAGSYFAVRANILWQLASQKLMYSWPIPASPTVAGTATPATALTHHAGKLTALFSKGWFVAGVSATPASGATSGCYFSWAFSTGGATAATQVKALLPAATVGASTAPATNNFISSTSTALTNTLDASNTAATSTGGFKIQSFAYSGAATPPVWQYGLPDAVAQGPGTLSATTFLRTTYVSSCLKWATSPTSVKSIYTNIDIIIRYDNSAANNAPSRTVRLMKLFTEVGAMNSYASGNTIIASPPSAAFFTYHFAYGTAPFSGTTNTAVCLLQVSKDAFNATNQPTGASALIIFAAFIQLIESDYNDPSSTYPAAPLVSGITPLGQTSANAHSNDSKAALAALTYTGSTVSALSTIYSATMATNEAGAETYHGFMSSYLMLTGISSGAITPSSNGSDLLVPTYCPYLVSGQTTSPLFAGVYLGMTAFNNVTKVLRYVASKPATVTLIFQSIGTKTALAVAVGTIAPATLKFNAYGSTGVDTLSVINGALPQATAPAISCSGFVLFADSVITFGSSSLPVPAISSVTLVTGNLPTTQKNFYVFGKVFNKGVLSVNSVATTSVTITPINSANMSTATSTVTYTNIVRPTVDALTVTTSGISSVVAQDHIAFFCMSAATSATANADINVLTNLAGGYFILDWGIGTMTWTAPTYTADKTEAVYKADPATNVRLALTFPTTVSKSSTVTFASSSITASTICGITTALTTGAADCSNSSGTITCSLPTSTATAIVCCYNFVLTDTFGLTSLSVSLPTSTAISSYMTTSGIYTNTAITSVTAWTTGNTSATDLINGATLSAKITAISYGTLTNQDSTLGKATFAISLPRELPRNAQIKLSGDFSAFIAPNLTPRCVVSIGTTFGSSWDNGDFLIDTCNLNNISTSSGVITINTKNIIYKCGIGSSKTLNLMLWPVYTPTITATTTATYKVTMTSLASGGDIIYNSATATAFPTVGTGAAAKPVTQGVELCTPTITPKIPGAYSEHLFNFDLTTNKPTTTLSINEATIFLPFNLYGPNSNNNIICMYKNAVVNCAFTDEGVITIRFGASNLTVGSSYAVTVIGLTAPGSDSDIYYGCALSNNPNTIASTRTAIITGTGKLTGGVNIPTSTATIGNLRFLTPVSATGDANPRNTSQHTLRVALDQGYGNPITAISSTSSFNLIVTFPSDYNLQYTSKPTATVEYYIYNTDYSIPASINISSGSGLTVAGNKITIPLIFPSTVTANTFPANMRYIDIKINGIAAPTNPVSPAVGLFDVILYDTGMTVLFRTFTNLNSQSSGVLSSAVNTYITNSRGYQYSFDNTKWAVNVNAASPYNTVTVKVGRFTGSTISVFANTSVTIGAATTSLTLTDTNIKIASPVTVSPPISNSVPIYIGVACGTVPGPYVVTLTSSNSSNFAVMPYITVLVDNSSAGSINFIAPTSVPYNGSAMIYYTLSDPNVDVLTINWTAVASAKNDSTASLTNTSIPVPTLISVAAATAALSPMNANSVFSINSSTPISNIQQFSSTNPNTCFAWSSPTISISISSTAAPTIDPNYVIPTNAFTYSSPSASDTTLTRNSLRFTFTSAQYAPAYIYCALVCNTTAFPSDATVKNSTSAQNTHFVQYYSTLITATSTPVELLFTRLVRGQTYNLKCLLGSSNLNSNNTASINLTSLNNASFTTVSNQPTYCVNYRFSADPGNATKIALINACQKLFSASTTPTNSNGCIVCTDSALSYTVPGALLVTNLTCTSNLTRSSLRFLQTTTTNTTANTTATTTAASFSYSVCAVQNQTCATDVSGSTSFSDMVSTLVYNTPALMQTNIGVVNVPITNATVVTDTTAPAINTVTISTPSVNIAAGTATWTSYSSTPLNCYFMVQTSATAPTFSALQTCTSNWCGTVKTNSAGTSTSLPAAGVSSLSYSTTYNVFYGCTNDIPLAQKQSGVSLVGSFVTSQSPTTPNTNITNGSNNSNITSSSSFVSFSMIVMLVLSALLIN